MSLKEAWIGFVDHLSTWLDEGEDGEELTSVFKCE